MAKSQEPNTEPDSGVIEDIYSVLSVLGSQKSIVS